MQEGLRDRALAKCLRLVVVPCWRTSACFLLLADDVLMVCCWFAGVPILCSCYGFREQFPQCAAVRPAGDEARVEASLRVTVGRGVQVTLGDAGTNLLALIQRKWME
jgi:hypothetical protein